MQTSRRLKPNETSDYYKALGKKCGLKINPHKFRHTVGTLLADKGLSAIEIAETLGDGVEVTTRHYINDSAIRVKNATNKMFELINEDTI